MAMQHCESSFEGAQRTHHSHIGKNRSELSHRERGRIRVTHEGIPAAAGSEHELFGRGELCQMEPRGIAAITLTH
jgi:hypothetical protein